MKYTFFFTISFLLYSVTCKKRLVLHSDMDIASEISILKSKLSQIETKMAKLETENAQLRRIQDIGSVYIRWGRKSCQGNDTTSVYKGYAAGNYHNDYGGGVNTLCMPDDPTWGNHVDAPEQWVGNLYGTEVDSADTKIIIGEEYNNEDVPCVMCKVARSSVVMIPGRTNCYPGWHQEYTGYLMSGYHGLKSNTDYICLDANPETIPHGNSDSNEHVMYFTEATCGSLPCPPYVNGRELACVVCSQ